METNHTPRSPTTTVKASTTVADKIVTTITKIIIPALTLGKLIKEIWCGATRG